MWCCSRSRSSRCRSTARSPVLPACAAARSSSEIAAAIHVTLVSSASSGPSAPAMPPAPRCAISLPSSSRPKLYGPRWETTITRRLPSLQLAVQPEPVLELAGRQELPPYDLPARGSHLGRALGRAQQVGGPLRRGLDVVDQVAVHSVFDL